jgi:mevalonate kinase
MDNPQFRTLLEKLRTELKEFSSPDTKAQESARHLLQEVEALLEHTGEYSSQHYQALNERLAQGIKQFEVENPELTWTMGHLADFLSRLGL